MRQTCVLIAALVVALSCRAAIAQGISTPRPVGAPALQPAAPANDAAKVPAARTAPAIPHAAAVDRTTLQLIATREAKLAGLPYSLVDTVIKIESDYRADRIGDVGEIGLMQVRPATAAMMGFQGSPIDLAEPSTNIHYGAAYLGAAWRLAKGNVCRALMKYRAGHGNETMSPLSVTYCQRARTHLASIDSPLAATITPADLVSIAVASVPSEARKIGGILKVVAPQVESTRPSENLSVNGRPKTGQAFWAAFQSRVHRINAGLEAKWKRTASR